MARRPMYAAPPPAGPDAAVDPAADAGVMPPGGGDPDMEGAEPAPPEAAEPPPAKKKAPEKKRKSPSERLYGKKKHARHGR